MRSISTVMASMACTIRSMRSSDPESKRERTGLWSIFLVIARTIGTPSTRTITMKMPASGTMSGPMGVLSLRTDVLCYREYELDFRSLARLALGRDGSMMCQNRLSRDSEPEASHRRLTCHIRLPNVFDSLWRNSAPGISHPDRDRPVPIQAARLDGHLNGPS